MSEDAESKSHAWGWVITVVAVLVLYVLSYGPVYALAIKYDMSGTTWNMIGTFYKPLDIGCGRLGAGGLLHSYYFWWCELFHLKLSRGIT